MDEKEREKTNISKEEMDLNASKRRKLKREHMTSEPGEYLPSATPPTTVSVSLPQTHDVRDRGDRKTAVVQRPSYVEEPGLRVHSKEAANKTRREADPIYDREWEDDKRQRAEPKRRHRK